MGFKFNGRWYVFNYQNWPLNQILSAIGSMSDQIRFSPEKWDEKSALSKGVAGMVSGVKSTLEIPALSGLQELVGNDNPNKLVGKLNKTKGQFKIASSVFKMI